MATLLTPQALPYYSPLDENKKFQGSRSISVAFSSAGGTVDQFKRSYSNLQLYEPCQVFYVDTTGASADCKFYFNPQTQPLVIPPNIRGFFKGLFGTQDLDVSFSCAGYASNIVATFISDFIQPNFWSAGGAPAYSFSVTGLLAAATTTFFFFGGPKTKNVALFNLQISGVATAAAVLPFTIQRRVSNYVGGSVTFIDITAFDYADPVAQQMAAKVFFTANPTGAGTAGGFYSRGNVILDNATAPTIGAVYNWTAPAGSRGIIIKQNEYLSIDAIGAPTIAGATLTISGQYSEIPV